MQQGSFFNGPRPNTKPPLPPPFQLHLLSPSYIVIFIIAPQGYEYFNYKGRAVFALRPGRTDRRRKGAVRGSANTTVILQRAREEDFGQTGYRYRYRIQDTRYKWWTSGQKGQWTALLCVYRHQQPVQKTHTRKTVCCCVLVLTASLLFFLHCVRCLLSVWSGLFRGHFPGSF